MADRDKDIENVLAFLNPERDKKTKAIARKPLGKLKVGDYITAPGMVFDRIVAVLDDPKVSTRPLYGVVNIKHDHMNWYSDFELESRKYVKSQPKFEEFNKLQIGDMVSPDLHPSNETVIYHVILARLETGILLSNSSNNNQIKQLLDLDSLLKEAPEGMPQVQLLDDRQRAEMEDRRSPIKTRKMADHWCTTDQLALMNWEIVPREEP